MFGYYSGNGRRLEQIFDKHQTNYYKAIATNDDEAACFEALQARRMFYCRPLHGIFALLTQLVFSNEPTRKLLRDTVKVRDFHSALCLLHEPWYAKGGHAVKFKQAGDFWMAGGPAGKTARLLKEMAFHPFGLVGNSVQDYREKKQDEVQFGVFLKEPSALEQLREAFSDDADMFYALEAMDVSDLIRDFNIWVTRETGDGEDVEYSDLSDGERQLLMVMGLLRVARGKRVLFLLDEPDTHLNPHWQHSYLQLLEQWTERVADADSCHIVLTSHNPLTISSLASEEVRVLSNDDGGLTRATKPYADPRGMGFTATLTEIFGMPTSLDERTQRLLDIRNRLVSRDSGSAVNQRRLLRLNDVLARLSFLQEDRDPMYQSFLRAWHDVRRAKRPPLTPEQLEAQHQAMRALIEKITSGMEHQ